MKADELIEQARARGSLDERAGKALLTAYGVAVPQSVIVKSPDAVAGALAGLKPPFVVKVMSPDILHKSDVGGVKVGLVEVAAVADAIRTMQAVPAIAKAKIEGFLVEEMAPRGVEVVIGGVRDADFGPMVMVGLGGIFVEVLKDVAFRICPITRVDAAEMLDELKGAKVLDGARGGIKASREAIVDALLKVGGEGGLLLTHASSIREADINPLIVSERGAVAADARFILG
ncbi:MAG: acetate--CoA ligase family protein [Burkholderiales bacterium]